MFKKALKLVKKPNSIDEASFERLLVKATEELGELAEAINWKNNYKKTNKSPKEISKLVNEESIDVIVCMLAIIDKNNPNHKKINKYFKKKVKKWYNNMLLY